MTNSDEQNVIRVSSLAELSEIDITKFSGVVYVRTEKEGIFRHVIYHKNGKRHNEDGPAVITYNNKNGKVHHLTYYLDGSALSKEEWFERLPEDKKKKLLYKLDEL